MTLTLDISSFARVFGVSKLYMCYMCSDVLILTFCSDFVKLSVCLHVVSK